MERKRESLKPAEDGVRWEEPMIGGCTWFFRIFALLALAALTGMPARAEDGAAELCDQHLEAISRALTAYQHAQGKLPLRLSDLCPIYLRDASLLHCPADRSAGTPIVRGVPSDPVPTSYVYEMSTAAAPPGLSLGLAPEQPAGPATWRDVKLHDRTTFGDRVPVVSCWHHLSHGYRAYLTPAGHIYYSGTYWEFDPETVSTMLDRLDHDLAGGTALFLKHWRPSALAWYCFAQEGHGFPGTRRQFRTAAGRLEAMVRQESELADKDGWSAVGSLWYAGGERSKAITAYEAATRRPRAGPAVGFLLLATIWRNAGRRSQEAALLRRMPKVRFQESDWITQLAYAYTAMNEPGRAAEWRLRRAELEAIGRPGVQEPADDAAGVCVRHLQAVGRALAAYRRDHMELPVHLSDLYPAYLPDRRLLHCPSDSSPGDQVYRWMESDPVPVSYLYEMSLAPHPRGMMLGPAPGGRVTTWRDLKMCHRVHFGDRVPVVSCWHHLQHQYRLDLTLPGQVYCSSLDWEDDPNSVMVLLDRMERDLAAGYEPFHRRWWPGTDAWFFIAQEGWAPGEVRNRMRIVAGKLAAAQRRDSRLALNSVADLTGSLWYAAGDTEKAVAAYRSAMTLPGRYPATAYLLLADVYRHTGRGEEADELLRRAPTLQPWEINSISLLAGIYAETGRREQAAVWSRHLPIRRRWIDPWASIRFLAIALALMFTIVLAIFAALWLGSRRRARVAGAAQDTVVLPPPGLAVFDLQSPPELRPAAAPIDFSRPAPAQVIEPPDGERTADAALGGASEEDSLR